MERFGDSILFSGSVPFKVDGIRCRGLLGSGSIYGIGAVACYKIEEDGKSRPSEKIL